MESSIFTLVAEQETPEKTAGKEEEERFLSFYFQGG